jgi:hypothetical protein
MRSTSLPVLRFLLGSALGLTLGLALGAPAAAQATPDASGFLYGTVTTRDGTEHEGRLRWGEEEAFWGDLFHGMKAELPRQDEVPEDQRRQPSTLSLFGFEISLDDDGDSGRQLAARYGDIREIEVTGRSGAVLVMKSGRRVEIDGGSNDVGGQILVWDGKRSPTELRWRDIERIRFRAAPADLAVDVRRLYGVVRTDEGDFRGFIQWDQDECLGTDELDGETGDGEMSIPMGDIRTIERRGGRASRVTLRDGRELTLDGTNDVNSSNRGIYVEDERFGRVLVSWDTFERADFADPPGSGPAYGAFEAGGPLRGTVTTRAGRKHTGRLIYDMDEEETWETLDGERRGIDYSIPLGMVASVTPRDGGASRVELRNGEVLELEGSADTGEDHAGLLVMAEGRRPVYVVWEDVRRIDFGR